MSTSAYYSFIPTAKRAVVGNASNDVVVDGSSPLIGHNLTPKTTLRQATVSPSSFAISPSTSSSSLNQFSSLTPTSVASSTSYSAASSSASSSSSSSSSASPSSTICSTAIVDNGGCTGANFQRHHYHHDHQEDQLHLNRDQQRRSSVTPVQSHRQVPQLIHSYTLHSLEPKPLKQFKTSGDYLEAMKEDLAEWLNRLYPDLDLSIENFLNQLETGSIICRHANNVTQMGKNFMIERQRQRLNSGQDSFNQQEPNNNNLTSSSSPTNSNHDSSINSLYSDKSQSNSIKDDSSMLSISILPKLDTRGNINWFKVKSIPFNQAARPGTFFARDNICQFILWCRSLNILECLLFETDDLVARKNEKSFILCLLEVARIGFKVGMPTPLIIQLEQEIDREIENDAKLQKQLELEEEKRNRDADTIDSYSEGCDASVANGLNATNGPLESIQVCEDQQNPLNGLKNNEEEEEEDFGPKPQVITNDLVSLHEKVVQLLYQCTCPTQFPMVRVGDNGKYKVGDKLIIFVRILRRHIMVRVGGGWQELSEFLRMKDPCRSKLYPSNHHHQQNHPHNHQVKLAPHSTVSKSRLVESSHHLNKALGHHNYKSGQRISGSASMSWLSTHNS